MLPSNEGAGDERAGGLPDWYMPPQMIGGHVTGPVLVGREPGTVVCIRQVLAYPVGAEIELEGHARGRREDGPTPERDRFDRRPALRVSLRFADGIEVALDDDAGLRTGRGPILKVSKAETASGGPDGRDDVRLTLWLWPLPPPGPLTLTCSWPSRGLGEADVVLDGDAIASAAGRAQPFWPES